MRRYAVETIVDENVKYYFIRDCETLEIVLLPSKYLKHKTKSNRSPNTVKRSAFSICYYLEYLEELSLDIPQVCGLDFEKIISTFKECGYDAAFCTEIYQIPSMEEAAKGAIEHLQPILDKVYGPQ